MFSSALSVQKVFLAVLADITHWSCRNVLMLGRTEIFL